jgi:hypothetical protein
MGLAIVCALAVHPLLGLVLVPVIYAIEHARKKQAIAKVVASHGSVDALKADIDERTERLHDLYRQHNVPQEDWKH